MASWEAHGLISLEPSSLPTPVGLSEVRFRIFRRKLVYACATARCGADARDAEQRPLSRRDGRACRPDVDAS